MIARSPSVNLQAVALAGLIGPAGLLDTFAPLPDHIITDVMPFCADAHRPGGPHDLGLYYGSGS